MRNKRTISHLFISLVLLAGLLGETRAMHALPVQSQLAPVTKEHSPKAIPGQYIVVFKTEASRFNVQAGTTSQQLLAAQEIVRKFDGTIRFTYTAALVGFSAKLPPAALEALRAQPGVAYIEADQKMTFDTIQVNPPTGLDRIDRRLLPLNNSYTYSETGTGVNAYIIDSGIWTPHTEFGGRATSDFSVVASLTDCLGHGTHVAGTVGGTTYGVAKNVALHSVRVGDNACSPTTANVIAGVNFVIMNRVLPAVANISIGGPVSAAEDTAVNNLIAAGVTLSVSAGNAGGNACNQSPADVAAAITVGSIDPTSDTQAGTSNFGPCVDLFAPGVNIVSSMPDGLPALCPVVSATPGSQSMSCSGTSMATPHVTGVAARFLETHPGATPAQVWAAIHAVDDIFGTTPGWPGVTGLGAGSPNEILHYGSLNDGLNDGDPHLTTVDGRRYDFQGAGEFVTLRDADGLEIQTRQSPIPTTFFPGPGVDGLATCVSLNTAVAARVGKHRVTYEPNLNGQPDPSGMQLRVDGVLKTLGPAGLNLGGGGRIAKTSSAGGLEIDFPDETALSVTPGWWSTVGTWFLNVDVHHTPALEGIMGAIPANSWLPALPDGSSMGPMPGPLHDHYIELYGKFANAWRVTDKTSLFDYAPGTSTDTFTIKEWPLEKPPCVLPKMKPVEPASALVAERACRTITDENLHKNCVFDVMVTGNIGFAKVYQVTQSKLPPKPKPCDTTPTVPPRPEKEASQ